MFHLGWFMGSGFSVQTWASDPWAGTTGRDWMKGGIFVDLASALERACFDYLLVEDTSMIEDAYGGSMETTLKYGLLGPKNDPVPLIPMLTQATKSIGVAVTLSTSFYHPYMAARTMTTLDHLTEGRVGLNVVTGSSRRAAQQYGYDDLMPHAERYQMAHEWMEAVGALWESWEEGAVLVDQEIPRYADHTKVHPVDFTGKYFRTRGPLNTIPGPQRRPVIVQAGASASGRDLAAKYAESMLAHGTSVESMKEFRQDMHRRMREYGRDPSTLKILFLIDVTLGEDDAVAEARAEARRLAMRTDAAIERRLWGLSYSSGGTHDFSKYDIDCPVPDVWRWRDQHVAQLRRARARHEPEGGDRDDRHPLRPRVRRVPRQGRGPDGRGHGGGRRGRLPALPHSHPPQHRGDRRRTGPGAAPAGPDPERIRPQHVPREPPGILRAPRRHRAALTRPVTRSLRQHGSRSPPDARRNGPGTTANRHGNGRYLGCRK